MTDQQRSTSPGTSTRAAQDQVVSNAIETPAPNETGPVYRIDKFVVPDHARPEFIDRVRQTHEFLRTLPGFVEDAVLEQTGGPGEFNIVTIAVWDGAASLARARETMTARYRAAGFNPLETLARLGIKADLADYAPVDAERLAASGGD